MTRPPRRQRLPLTHLNYAFALINNDYETLNIQKESRLKLMVALKKQNPKLKVLLSIGGWGAGNFSEMAADGKHRKTFARNCLNAVTKYGLDGIDIDWEYPTSSSAGISSSPEDTKNFTLLMKDLREALGNDRLLTMASASNAKYVDFKEAIPYLNFVNVMTYDMGHPPKHNSALYRSSMSSESCDESVNKHLSAGVPLEKIVLGIPFYGHGDGKAFDDYVDYKDIKIDQSKYSVQWDATAMVPYVTDAAGKMVLNFDDDRSVGLKAEYAKQKNLAGAMYWNIEADDASHTLGHAVASHLLPGYVPPTPPEDPEAILVTNPYVQKYLEEVNYPETNNPDTDVEYSFTRITDYPGGGPGEADIPPTHTISWTSDASAGSLKLHVREGDWSRDYSLAAGAASQAMTNLVPGREYQWTVTSTAGPAAPGVLRTQGPQCARPGRQERPRRQDRGLPEAVPRRRPPRLPREQRRQGGVPGPGHPGRSGPPRSRGRPVQVPDGRRHRLLRAGLRQRVQPHGPGQPTQGEGNLLLRGKVPAGKQARVFPLRGRPRPYRHAGRPAGRRAGRERERHGQGL